MKREINIAEILKDCPKGMKLYSSAFGELSLLPGPSQKDIRTIDTHGNVWNFYANGSFSNDSDECILFPSKDQRDWSKFDKPVLPPFEIKHEKGVFYFVGSMGEIVERVDKGDMFEEMKWGFGNYFNTFEQAEYAAQKVKELLLSLRKEAGNE